MAKQSPKDPKFRCNICKKYYYALEHPVHYQCPKHGYLCEDHVGNDRQLIYGHNNQKNRNFGSVDFEKEKPNPEKNKYFDKIIGVPSNLIGKCLCSDVNWNSEKNHSRDFFYDYQDKYLEYKFESDRCKKTPSKFIWNENVQRWLEEGRDKEQDFIKKQKEMPKPIQNNTNTEIKLLVDLFEKDILDKSQFLEQLKSKL